MSVPKIGYSPYSLPIGRYFGVVPADPTQPAPEAVYQFDGGGSALTDRTGNGHDLSMILSTANYWTSPRELTGFYFNADRVMQAPASEALRIAMEDGGIGDASLSVEMLIRPTIDDTTRTVFNMQGTPTGSLQTNPLWYFYQSGGTWRNYGARDAYVTSDVAVNFGSDFFILNVDQYMVLTISADGTIKTLHHYRYNYIQESVQVSAAAEKASAGNTQLLTIGTNGPSSGGSQKWRGVLYALRITPTVLTRAQMDATYQEVTGSHTPLARESAGLQDVVRFPVHPSLSAGADQGKNADIMLRHETQIPHGFRQWGRGPENKGGFQDDLRFPPQTKSTGSAFGLRHGSRLDAGIVQSYIGNGALNRGSYDDTARAELLEDVAQYINGKLDADSRAFTENVRMLDAIVINTTRGSFGQPAISGHWGAARDGKFYAGGTECAFGTFGTLAGGINRAAWRVSDLQPFATEGTFYGTPPAMSADDVLHFDMTASSSYQLLSSEFCWYLDDGDFDIAVDFENLTWSAGIPVLNLLVRSSYGGSTNQYVNDVVVRRWGGVGTADNWSRYTRNGSTTQQNLVSTSGGGTAEGGLRIQREGANVRTYYKTSLAGGWVELGAAVASPLNGRCFVQISFSNSGGGMTGSCDVENMQLLGGTTDNHASWYEEAFGSHRGSQQEMPATLVGLLGFESLDLIDFDNNKLWMRFQAGSGWGYRMNGTPQCRMLTWDANSGTLMYSTYDSSGDDGCGAFVMFSRERIQVFRNQASTVTGGIFGPIQDASYFNYRNTGRGYYLDDDTWSVRHGDVYGQASAEDPTQTYLYVAWGGPSGVDAFKVRMKDRTVPELVHANAPVFSSVSHLAWDPSSLELYYFQDGYIRSVSMTTLDGLWAPSGASSNPWPVPLDEQPYPGTKTANAFSQERFFKLGNELLVCADQGVYASVWPAAFSLKYSDIKHGGSYPVLPDYDACFTIGRARDVNYLLLVGIQKGDWYQIAAINTNTDQLYGVSPLKYFWQRPYRVGGNL